MRRFAGLGPRGARAAVALVSALAVGGLAAPAGAAVFSNPAEIRMQNGAQSPRAATPYPSPVTVSGLTGAVTNVTATITNLSHTFPADMDVLLVGPAGQSVVLLADQGGATDVNGVTLTFSDAAAAGVPSPITSGTFRPTNLGTFNAVAPAPPPPYANALAIFNGTVPNGEWRLFVVDDFGPADAGVIAGGWSLDVTTNGPTVASFAPATGAAGTSVVITGTNLTGATSVTFGGIPAAAFTVNNPTTITATVPGGAVSGPITVTTPNGTASSTASYAVTPPPTVDALAPATGAVGTAVTITGKNLAGASDVRFGGTPAAGFTVTSPTAIATTVPAGAGAGSVSVVTPGGTGVSTAPFVVTHARSASLTVRRRVARGRVSVDDGFAKCAAGVPVALERRKRGAWRRVGGDVTEADGRWILSGRRAKGRYRAVARATTIASGDGCLEAVSDVVRR